MVGGERSLRLTSDCNDSFPTWSPDGRRVAFYRFWDGGGIAFYVVPALGGTEHRLHRVAFKPWSSGLSWSPDGSSLAFPGAQENESGTWISLLSLADSSTRRLTSPSGQDADYSPAFSPDGSRVAFVRGTLAGVVQDLYVVPTRGGEPKRLTFDRTWIKGSPTWTPDGRDIVFSSPRRGLLSLWRISASGRTPRPLANIAMASYPSISGEGNQLVYLHQVNHDNIWRVALRDEKHIQGSPTSLISAKWYN